MLKVLVVEDEELIRKGIVLAIDWASLDCVVVGQAANGEEGLEQAEKCRPGLIITDLKMPKMDGLEMIAQLRARGNDAFVIILTAYDSFAYAQQALRLGAVDFLLKPFHDGDLENAVIQLQNKLSQRRKPPEVRLQEIRSGAKTRYVQEAMDYIGKNCGSSELSVSQVAYALGLSEGQTMIKIVLPQAVRNIMPSIGNEFVVNIKDSSVLNVISVNELFFQSKSAAGTYARYFEVFFITACIYLALTFTVTRLLRLLERKMDGNVNYTIYGSQSDSKASIAVPREEGVPND